MGTNKNGKELGKGLSQLKDGRYSARFVCQTGKRLEKHFDRLSDARSWLEDARYHDKHDVVLAPFHMVADNILDHDQPLIDLSTMTVDEWFDFWLTNIVSHLAWNTKRNYQERYVQNIQPLIGRMRVQDVRPMHCNKIFIDMDGVYSNSTIKQTYITLGTLFRAAVNNGVISKHPMDGIKFSKPMLSENRIKFFTIIEQEQFMEAAKGSHNYRQYVLILETGLRIGELIGLTWDDIDFENRTLTIRKTLEYRHSRGTWEAGSPKTLASYRTIPLTDKAYDLLLELYNEKDNRKQAEELYQELYYKDKKTGEKRSIKLWDLVFINFRTGMPTKNSSYDTHLYKLCDKAGIRRLSVHGLRHTYATRAIERGINPKVLQQLLGHSSLITTTDTYVHVTDDSMRSAVEQFQKMA